jgi:hypothetical protein
MGATRFDRRHAAVAAAACTAAIATGASAQNLSTTQLYAALEPSVWVVRTFDKDDLPLGQGSAVVIAADTLATNCHVLRKARRVEATHHGVARAATLELWDTARDLCQLRVPGLQAPAVALAADDPLVGQAVVALGAPAGLELTLSTGIVSAVRRDDAGRVVVIQTSAAVSRGSSGGGLFDERGRLVGITTATIAGSAQNLNLALPVAMVRELPERHAAAQRAKAGGDATARTSAASQAAGGGSEPATAAAAPTTEALAGQWSGDFRCGPYLLQATVANPNGWSVTATMTVGGDGHLTMLRGDTLYSESVSGDLRPDLTATLRGRGAHKVNRSSTWTTEVDGRFSGAGKDARFEGEARVGSASGATSRNCTVRLTKNDVG